MRARDDEVQALARNVLVVATYWPSFAALGRRSLDAGAALGQGAYQVMALVAPYLVGSARTHLDRLGQTYLD
jgi:hypothetical protein